MFNIGSLLNLDSTEPVTAKTSIEVACPPADIFKFIGDDFIQNYPKWSPEVKELKQITPGSVKIGTIVRQVRVDVGRRSEANFKITIYERNSRIGFAGVSDPFRCIYDLEEINSEKTTRLTFTFELLELLMIMRPMEALVRSTIKDGADRTVKNIKRLMETK